MNHTDTPPTNQASGRKVHRSTCVILVMLLVVVFLVNFPGTISDPNVHGFCDHGWPFVYLRRGPVLVNNSYWRLSNWLVLKGAYEFSAASLVADVAIGCTIAIVGALLFEAWRRRRTRLLRFYLGDLLILITFVSSCFGFYCFQRSQYQREQRAWPEVRTRFGRLEWKRGGPSWLRQLVGDRPFQVLDRVVEVETSGPQLEHIAKLRHLRVVVISGTVSEEQLRFLEVLPRLEELYLERVNVGSLGRVQQYVSIPKLPNLRVLNLFGTAFRGDGLENIPAIEVLDLRGTEVGDKSVPALSKLTTLHDLSLYDTDLSHPGIEQLQKALPDCNVTW